jgi:hypothetical protein
MSESVSACEMVSSSAKVRRLSSKYADNVYNGTMTVAGTRELLLELQTLKAGWTSLGSAELDRCCHNIGRHSTIADLFDDFSTAAELSMLTKDVDQDGFISDAAKVVRLIAHYEHGLRRALSEATPPSEAHAGAEKIEPNWSIF